MTLSCCSSCQFEYDGAQCIENGIPVGSGQPEVLPL